MDKYHNFIKVMGGRKSALVYFIVVFLYSFVVVGSMTMAFFSMFISHPMPEGWIAIFKVVSGVVGTIIGIWLPVNAYVHKINDNKDN